MAALDERSTGPGLSPQLLSQLVTPADPNIVTPSAVAAMSEAFRQGQITADFITSRFGKLAKTKEKAEIMGLEEKMTPEARQARLREQQLGAAKVEAESGLVTPRAEEEATRIETAKMYGLFPAAKVFDDNAAGMALKVPRNSDGTVDWAAKAELGVKIAEHKAALLKDETDKTIALRERANIDGFPSTDSSGNKVMHSITKQGVPVPDEVVKALDERINKPKPVFQGLSPGEAIGRVSTTPPVTPPVATTTPPVTPPVAAATPASMVEPAQRQTDEEWLRTNQIAGPSIVEPLGPPQEDVTPTFTPADEYRHARSAGFLRPIPKSSQSARPTITPTTPTATSSAVTPIATASVTPIATPTPAAAEPRFGDPAPGGGFFVGGPKPETIKAPTEAQGRAQLALSRFSESSDMIAALKTANYDPTSIGSWMNSVLPQVLKSGNRKTYEAAVDAWAQGLLRLESGAAITPKEKTWYMTSFFPQVNDPPSLVTQKELMRNGIERMVGEIAQAGGVISPESVEHTKRIYAQAEGIGGKGAVGGTPGLVNIPGVGRIRKVQ